MLHLVRGLTIVSDYFLQSGDLEAPIEANSATCPSPEGTIVPSYSPATSLPRVSERALKGYSHSHTPHTWATAHSRTHTLGVETRLESGDNRRAGKLSWHWLDIAGVPSCRDGSLESTLAYPESPILPWRPSDITQDFKSSPEGPAGVAERRRQEERTAGIKRNAPWKMSFAVAQDISDAVTLIPIYWYVFTCLGLAFVYTTAHTPSFFPWGKTSFNHDWL